MKEAREALKSKFMHSATTGKKTPKKDTIDPIAQATEEKVMRSWVGVKEKISKKDMELVDVSQDKGGQIDIDRQKKIYLGGDDDELEGFYNSDDEIDFENFKKGKKG